MIRKIHDKVYTDCILWKGAKTGGGYGAIYIASTGKTELAHRHFYLKEYGSIPYGLQLDHLCRNRACVNPKHLEPVTAQTNVLRGESLPAQNARKTHCVRGHEFTEKTTRIRPNGGRACRTCVNICDRERRRVRAEAEGRTIIPLPKFRVECPKGHPYNKENTYIKKCNGNRACRICLKDVYRRYKAKRSQLYVA